MAFIHVYVIDDMEYFLGFVYLFVLWNVH